jgi:hypothetical protein
MGTCSKTKQILYPWGGCGNLLRWIVYLDKEYDPHHLVDDKVKYIQDIVYGSAKTWYNWRDMEYIHHDRSSIDISHQRLDNFVDTKTLLIHFANHDPIINRFFILMPDLWAVPDAKYGVSEHLNQRDTIVNGLTESESLKILSGDCLFYPDDLDTDFYQSIIDYFGFDNNYQHANKVFHAWKNCERRAVIEFKEAYTSNVFKNLLKELNEQDH